jgi:hypothetical protein
VEQRVQWEPGHLRYPLDKKREALQIAGMKPTIVTSILVIVAFFAGMSASLFLIPFWIIPFRAAIEKSSNPADWIGFGGNFAAGIMTLVGAVIAWVAIQRQIQAQEIAVREAEERRQSERLETQAEAKESAVAALSDPIEAAGNLLYCIQRAKVAIDPDEIMKWDGTVDEACVMLARALQHFSLAVLASDLAWKERRKYLNLLASLSSFEIFVGKRPSTMPRIAFLDYVIENCIDVHKCVTEFDSSLGKKFEKESSLD